MSLRFLHTADWHLDSAFEGLPTGKASIRRGEQRDMLLRLAALVEKEKLQLVLLPGDLLDSDNTYHETGAELVTALEQMAVPVFIAPGNHDYYGDSSPYARLKFPPNVHIFTRPELSCVELEALGVRVWGAAFVDKRSRSLLEGFAVPPGGEYTDLLCVHGDFGARESVYNPISEKQLAASGIDYAALGHIHTASGLRKAGQTFYAWPGCPEGRGFDETGEKTVYLVELSGGSCELTSVSVAKRAYRTLSVDVTGSDPLLAVHTQLGDDTVSDIYRITLTGEVEEPPDLNKLRRNLDEFFFELQLRDATHLKKSVWDRAGEDTLRGLFLLRLRERYDAARSDDERELIEQAARWGLAAIDRREEVISHADP